MKITILFLALISCAFVAVNAEGMCRNLEVKVYSSIQPVSQTFTLDVKKIRDISFKTDESEFRANNFIPLEQVGFVLEKTTSSKVLDAIQHKYLRNEPNSVWLPYSYTGDWTRNGYVLTNQMKRTSASKTEYPLVSFEFVNDFDLASISSSDMDKVLTNLRYNSGKRKTIKTLVKDNVMKYQNAYLSNSEAYKKMKEKNQDAKTQITELTLKLSTTVTEINTLITKEKTYQQEEAVKSASLSTVNDQIDDLIAKLKVLIEQLKKEEKELNDLKPTDITQIQSTLNAALLNVQYPQRNPQRFLEEYAIAAGNKFTIVTDNYKNCKQDNNLLQQCMMANMQSSSIKKKLRRSFF